MNMYYPTFLKIRKEDNMATVIRKIKKGRPYYYAVQCGRVDGKPRIVWQKYLGTVEAMVRRADEAAPPKPEETVVFEAGGVAALLGIAERLGLLDLINEAAPKREQGPSVGHYMLLAALNRALCPLSKLAIGRWYDRTALRRLWRFDKSAFSSQRFWDHMDRLSEEQIEVVQERLVARIEKAFGLDARLLLYDTTNFFTFIATTNGRSALARRGRSKQKRNDLRLVGLALLVTRDFQIPLLHRVYPGDVPDVSLFPRLTEELLTRCRRVSGTRPDATLVFDKGNVSDDAMEELIVGRAYFVTALAAGRCPELLATPLERFRQIEGMPGCKAFDTRLPLWGGCCRAVVLYSESFFTRQLQGVTQNLAKCQKKLLDLGKSLEKWRLRKGRGRKPTLAGTRRRVREILSPQFMKDLIRADIEHDPSARGTAADKSADVPRLSYSVDHAALERLGRERLGRTVLVTNRIDWDAQQTVESYRNLSAIEEAFKNMKNTDFLNWRPAWHWTDQKLRVHAFYCVTALMLSSLARKVARNAGVDLILPALLEELSAIREVAVIYPRGTLARPRDHIALSRMSPRQKKLAEALQIGHILTQKG